MEINRSNLKYFHERANGRHTLIVQNVLMKENSYSKYFADVEVASCTTLESCMAAGRLLVGDAEKGLKLR